MPGTDLTISSLQTIRPDGVIINSGNVSSSGGSVRITGENFSQGMTGLLIRTATGVPVVITSGITVNSSTELYLTIPATTIGAYILAISDSIGRTAWKFTGLTISVPPAWVSAQALGTVQSDTFFGITLQATGATSYTLANGSTLPAGVTISSNNLSGVINIGANLTQSFSFTIIAANADQVFTARTFTLTVSKVSWKNKLILPVNFTATNSRLIGINVGSSFEGARVVLTCGSPTEQGRLYVSADNGTTWTINSAAGVTSASQPMYSIGQQLSPINQRRVAIGLGNGRLITSLNLTTWNTNVLWTPIAGKQNRVLFVECFYVSNTTPNFWLAGGDNAKLYRSTDGSTWSPSPALELSNSWGPNNSINGVLSRTTNQSIFIAYGTNGKLARSFNGIDWEVIDIVSQGWSATESITCGCTITSGGISYFVIGGQNGLYALSTDGLTWTVKTNMRNSAFGYSINEMSSMRNGPAGNMISVTGGGKYSYTSDFGDSWTTISYVPAGALNPKSVSLSLLSGGRILAADSGVAYGNW